MGIIEDLQQQVTGGGTLTSHSVHTDPQHPMEAPLSRLLDRAGGISGVVARLRSAGLGERVSSWLNAGANAPIEPMDVMRAFGSREIDEISAETGHSKTTVAALLSRALPALLDHLSPDGRLPENEPGTGPVVQLATSLFPELGEANRSPQWTP